MKRVFLGVVVLFMGCPGEVICGDGVQDDSEACDDGNVENGDGCDSACIVEVCGDNLVNDTDEECDDGNVVSGDGCSDVCVNEFCGDNVVNNNNEACDDGNTANGDGCNSACVVEFCGDNLINNTNETCDDGNTENGDGCNDVCIVEFCGDNIINNNDEGCDDGNATEGDGCDSTCLPTGCESGVLTAGEFCYDGVSVINVGNSPQNIVAADFNADGHIDVAATSLTDQVFLFFGDGTGALNQQANIVLAANATTSDISAADLDKDGDIDLLVVNGGVSNTGQINVLLNNGAGVFGAPVLLNTLFFTRAVVVDDFNGDSNPDLVVPSQNSDAVQRFLGDGAGNFAAASDISIGAPFGVNTGDVNGDGAADLLVRQVGVSSVSLFLNLNNGSGDFAAPVAIPTAGPTRDAKLFDFDENGSLDLAVTVDFGVDPDRVTFFSNSGASLSQVAEVTVGGDSTTLNFSDLNGDGALDMVQLDFLAASYFISSGLGGFTFSATSTFPANFPAQFAIGDLNEDGLEDLILANQIGTLRISLFEP